MKTTQWHLDDCRIKILFRIPFTMYWLGKIQGNCHHEWSKIYLFIKDFESGIGTYYWKVLV